jgi:hypothetical protein
MNIASLSGITKVAAALAGGSVLAGAVALGATGGSGGSAPPAQVVQLTPTSVPEERSADNRLDPGQPRTDCPDGWTYYNDPDGYFSFCFPPELKATQGNGVPGGSRAVSVNTPQDGPPPARKPNSVTFTIYWKPDSPFSRGLLPDRCDGDRLSFGITTRTEVRTTARRQASACVGNGPTAVHGIDPVSIEIPDDVGGGFIQIFAFQSGPDLDTTTRLLNEMMGSVRIRGEP